MFRRVLLARHQLTLLWGMSAILCTLYGCGQKGNPQPPAGERDTFPGQYPKGD